MKTQVSEHDTTTTVPLDDQLHASRAGRMLWWLARMLKLQKRRAIVSFFIKWICRMEGGEVRTKTARTILRDWYEIHVGFGSYGAMFRAGAFRGITHVGCYSSVAPNVHAIERNHPVNWASTSSFFYDPGLGVVADETLPDYQPLVIGHDVWIGWGTIILPGCRRIGDGAVIGAGSVVTQDIPDYAIAAGVPAKILRYRFDEEIRSALKASEWWTLPPSQLKHIAAEFLHELSPANIDQFQRAVKTARETPA